MTPDEARAILGPQLAEAVRALVGELLDREREIERERADTEWPSFMRLPTAASYADTSVETIRKWISRGVLSVVQEGPGHAIYVERAELDRALREWRQR